MKTKSLVFSSIVTLLLMSGQSMAEDTVPATAPSTTPVSINHSTTDTTEKKPKLSQEEREKKIRERLTEAFNKHDEDKDGKLSLEEFIKMDKARAKKKHGKKHMHNPEFIKKHDTNSDGKVDESEMKAAREAHKEEE